MLAEFTKDDINALISQGPTLRVAGQGSPSGHVAAAAGAPAAPSPPAAPPPPGPAGSATPNGGNAGWGDPTG